MGRAPFCLGKPLRWVIFSLLIGVILGAGSHVHGVGQAFPLPRRIPEGWVLVEGPRRFTKESLFEHIDGQAELFHKYGFQTSVFAVYRDKKNPEFQIDLDIYDMGNVLQAFGIFSRFRGGNNPAGVGLDSFADDHSFLFYKGRYFVMVYATERMPSVLKELAEAVSIEISDPSPAPREIGLFPKRGLKVVSIQYLPDGLLGHQFLKAGFQGSYVSGEKEFFLFLALFGNSHEARKAWEAYRDYLSRRGKGALDIPTRFGPNAFKGMDPYRGEIIVLLRQRYLIGVMGSQVRGEGEDRLEEFGQNLP